MASRTSSKILSPASPRTDVLLKSRLYASFAIPSYWIVDPDLDRLELYRLEQAAYALVGMHSSPAVVQPAEFPGLEIPLRN